ncbi:MAG: hypothetical protein GYA23_03660 [Methanomicrobiales archaeon]|nr:hypothetical protein [Methanomicrobiales archaeon]
MTDKENPDVIEARRFWEFWILAASWCIVIACVLTYIIPYFIEHKVLPPILPGAIQFWPWIPFIGLLIVISAGQIILKITGWKLTDEQQELTDRCFYLIIVILVIGTSIVFLFTLPGVNLSATYKTWPIILILLIPLIPGVIIAYPALYHAIHPLSEEQVRDPRRREITLCMPYDKAFGLCEQVLESLDTAHFTDARVIDRSTGTLSVFASPLIFMQLKLPTKISISLLEKNPGLIQVTVFCITKEPAKPGLMIPTGLNEQYLTYVCGCLEKKTELLQQVIFH